MVGPKNILIFDYSRSIFADYSCPTKMGALMRGHKVVVPESLYDKMLMDLHSSHLSIIKTKASRV